MAVFEYKALTNKGKNISGIIDAESAAAAKSKLRQKNNTDMTALAGLPIYLDLAKVIGLSKSI